MSSFMLSKQASYTTYNLLRRLKSEMSKINGMGSNAQRLEGFNKTIDPWNPTQRQQVGPWRMQVYAGDIRNVDSFGYK